MMYNKIVQDYFFLPKHVGVIDLNHALTVMVKNSQKNQGIIELYLQCDSEGKILRACFKTNGNPYVIAGLEWLCRQLEGKAIDNVPQIDHLLIIKNLDIPIAQYPIALRILDIYKEVMLLIKNKPLT
ncbi:putative iron-sulpher cluster proteins NifU [Legionella sainthelensi]|uniref:Putative iron-sulpher cluster proteins NifU n=1 Tax=Legionella sainthelensi TaxID=28087 RepID=A0A0W0YT72_9GAMM|nr:iron-sulfur cluster assembly scaffold protein [Legionella sainthelensi]KTD59838.1 putative iron-sulpher cluster proteins NifU [Legionella sainthelensi]VEH31277.1 iron-sulfer cluster proteins NifU [Legionella sainthelensi]